MRRLLSFISIFILLAGLVGCENGKRNYYLKNKWYTSSSSFFKVREHPRQVTEYFYRGLSDISIKDPGRYGSYDRFKFDAEGNLEEHKLFFDSSNWNRFAYTYSDNGYDIYFHNKSRNGSMEMHFIKFEPVSDGKFREIKYPDSFARQITYTWFRNGGNEVFSEQETGEDSTKTVIKTHSVYDGDRVLTQEQQYITGNKTISRWMRYYYDSNNQLDSIVRQSRESAERKIFLRNEYGDPVVEIATRNRDTIEHRRYQYLYDSKKNWIRCIEQDLTPYTGFSTGQSTVLITREIVY